MGTSLDLVVWTPNRSIALRAEGAVLDEIDRLCAILSTYDSSSEISEYVRSGGESTCSRELNDVLQAYEEWERRTSGAISPRLAGAAGPMNVDALGKAYVIDRAATAARCRAPSVDGVVLNVGGDIVAWGRPCALSIADPFAPTDNGRPLAELTLADGAVATSGSYERGAHIVDPRTRRPVSRVMSATVAARDCVTANALATALCVTGRDEGVALIEATPGAEALIVERSGAVHRSAGFGRLERHRIVPAAAPENWPVGFELSVIFTLTGLSGRRARRPYVAVWIEDGAAKLTRILAVWGDRNKYLSDLPSFWRLAGRNERLLYSVTRATRDAGRYRLAWNGFDEDGRPVPMGAFKVSVETNQQHGDYAKQTGTIVCGGVPASIRLKATENFDVVDIQYGPRAAA